MRAAAAGLALALLANVAHAEALVVVEAKGVKLQAGQSVDGAQKLVLKDGERVTLISPDGRTIKLRGPYEEAPAPGAAAAEQSGDVVKSLKTLINTRQAGTGTLGVVRAGGQGPDLPEPWVIDTSRPGARCILGENAIVLWRQNATQALELEISPADKSWRATSVWPAGSDRISLPPAIPVRDGRNFVFDLNKQSVAITFHVKPAQLSAPAAQAAWMIEKGCDGQATALLKVAE